MYLGGGVEVQQLDCRSEDPGSIPGISSPRGPFDGKEVFGRPGACVRVSSARQIPLAAHTVGSRQQVYIWKLATVPSKYSRNITEYDVKPQHSLEDQCRLQYRLRYCSKSYRLRLVAKSLTSKERNTPKNKTNHLISSNSHPSPTANIAIHRLKRGGGGLQSQREHHII